MSFTEFINDPKVWLAIFGIITVLIGIGKLARFLRDRSYKDFPNGNGVDNDLIDRELEQRNRNKINQLKQNR